MAKNLQDPALVLGKQADASALAQERMANQESIQSERLGMARERAGLQSQKAELDIQKAERLGEQAQQVEREKSLATAWDTIASKPMDDAQIRKSFPYLHTVVGLNKISRTDSGNYILDHTDGTSVELTPAQMRDGAERGHERAMSIENPLRYKVVVETRIARNKSAEDKAAAEWEKQQIPKALGALGQHFDLTQYRVSQVDPNNKDRTSGVMGLDPELKKEIGRDLVNGASFADVQKAYGLQPKADVESAKAAVDAAAKDVADKDLTNWRIDTEANKKLFSDAQKNLAKAQAELDRQQALAAADLSAMKYTPDKPLKGLQDAVGKPIIRRLQDAAAPAAVPAQPEQSALQKVQEAKPDPRAEYNDKKRLLTVWKAAGPERKKKLLENGIDEHAIADAQSVVSNYEKQLNEAAKTRVGGR